LNALNEKVVQLQESGIMRIFYNNEAIKAVKEESDPVPLSIDHLSIWFKLWMGLLMVAVFFFVAEVLRAKCCVSNE
jgi:hypothetical protein